MTDDLIHLLRTWPAEHMSDVALLNEAADALEAAKRENDRLREALEAAEGFPAVVAKAIRDNIHRPECKDKQNADDLATILETIASGINGIARAALSGERQEGEG